MPESKKSIKPDKESPARTSDKGLDWDALHSGRGLSRKKRAEISRSSRRSARRSLRRATLNVTRRVKPPPKSAKEELLLRHLFSRKNKKLGGRASSLVPDQNQDEQDSYFVTENRFDDYREPDSSGTMAHRKLNGDKTQFRGCLEVEAWLIENGLLREKEFDNLCSTGKILDALSSDGKVIEQPFFFPSPEEIIFVENEAASSSRRPPPISEASFFYRFATDAETRGFALRDFTPSSWHPLAELTAPSASDLKEAHLRELFCAGHWEGKVLWQDGFPVEERVDPKLRASAFLAMRGLTSKGQLERIYPFLEHKDFERCLSQVHAAVEKTLPELFRRFLKFWDGLDLDGNELPYLDRLTPRQKEVLTLIYFKDMSQAEIARRDDTTESTISEHVSKATDKFKKCFGLPLLSESRPKFSDGKSYWAALSDPPDSTEDGFYRHSSKTLGALYEVDPETGLKTGLWSGPIVRNQPVGHVPKKIKDWNEYERPKYRTVPRPQAAPTGLTTRLKGHSSATEEALEPLPAALAVPTP